MDRPYVGIATYVRATAYWRHTATNFWQEIPQWDDDRLDVFAGFAGRDHDKNEVVPLLDVLEIRDRATEEQLAALDAAAEATRARLRRLLGTLAADWKQFSAYFLAYKHGGLALHRDDFAFVDDDVEEVSDETPRREVSIAVWRRGQREDIHGDSNLNPDAVARYVAGAGRLTIDLIDAFVASRLAIFEALELTAEGELVGLHPMQVPWTIWLRQQDLAEEHWRAIGPGPRITPIGEHDAQPSGDVG